MSNPTRTSLALGAALVGGLALSGSAFAMNDLAAGYMLGAAPGVHDGKHEARPGHTVAHMDTDKDGVISKGEFGAAHDGDTSRFATYDADKDGAITETELDAGHAGKTDGKAMEGKCGEGKCGAGKSADAKPVKAVEGKCGEGKCGEGKCGGAA